MKFWKEAAEIFHCIAVSDAAGCLKMEQTWQMRRVSAVWEEELKEKRKRRGFSQQ